MYNCASRLPGRELLGNKHIIPLLQANSCWLVDREEATKYCPFSFTFYWYFYQNWQHIIPVLEAKSCWIVVKEGASHDEKLYGNWVAHCTASRCKHYEDGDENIKLWAHLLSVYHFPIPLHYLCPIWTLTDIREPFKNVLADFFC